MHLTEVKCDLFSKNIVDELSIISIWRIVFIFETIVGQFYFIFPN